MCGFILFLSIGENIKILIDRPDGQYCFRLHKERVYYVSEEIMKKAGNISRDNLVCLGTCLGKFTKTKKFRLHVTALDYLAPYAQVISSFLISVTSIAHEYAPYFFIGRVLFNFGIF